MKCFYHNDHDGHASGAIVKLANPACEMFEFDYSGVFPMSKIVPGEVVFMVDISLGVNDMKILNDQCDLIYIDHHKSAIMDFKSAGLKLKGLTDISDNTAACELTWMYLFPDLDMPEVVSIIANYDTWNLSDEVLDLEYGLRSIDTNPATSMELWKDLFENNKPNNIFSSDAIEDISDDGVTIRQYLELYNDKYVIPNMFVVEFEGLQFLTINHPRTDSTIFDGVFDKKIHDAMMVFRRCKNDWAISLYGGKDNKNDLSVIAKKYGGGGHMSSSGFRVKNLPFQI